MSNYTISKLKTFTGMEGHGFTLTLLRDGKVVAEVRDAAEGGPIHFDWKDFGKAATVRTVNYKDEPHEFQGTAEEALFYAYCLAQPKHEDFDKVMRHTSPEMVINGMVNSLLCERRLKRMFKTKLVFIMNGTGYTYPLSAGESIAALIAELKPSRPGAVFLNTLELDAAIPLALAARI
ncbi:hypothetical protein [Burkholderia cepacia]|uniref:hypothetical protein n=1 Tax=Burkholderia cepacia TaxID=292 RepID=UPI002AB755DB|nr:hypothetical protein [Burkholderia cepacia]